MPFYDPDTIRIPDRFREHIPDIDLLANDINTMGQLQPILVKEEDDGSVTLVDGHRRMLACKSLGRMVFGISQKSMQGQLDMNSELQLKRMELMANVARCDFTGPERAKALAQIDAIMKETFGQKRPGPISDPENPGWSYADTAALTGNVKGTIVRAVALASVVDAVPEAAKADTVNEAEKLVLRAIQTAARNELLRRADAKKAVTLETLATADPQQSLTEWVNSKVLTGKAETLIKPLPNESVTYIFTDPPYNINFINRAEKGLATDPNCPYKYDDTEGSFDFATMLPEFARVLKQRGWLFMFCSIEQFLKAKEQLTSLGLSVFDRPLVWIKGTALDNINPSYNPNPFSWPSCADEFILMAKKGNPSVAKHRHNVICLPRLTSANKEHPSEKPVELMKYLIEWVHHDIHSGLLLDPYCGSGATLLAAAQFQHLEYLGFELVPQIADLARGNLLREKMK